MWADFELVDERGRRDERDDRDENIIDTVSMEKQSPRSSVRQTLLKYS